ncbi:MAG: hypothetical protein WKF71_09570 [Pyrinomonadaceae bacterium]
MTYQIIWQAVTIPSARYLSIYGRRSNACRAYRNLGANLAILFG